MRTLEVLNARAFRLALAFALAIALATTAAFAFIYWQVYSGDMQRCGRHPRRRSGQKRGRQPGRSAPGLAAAPDAGHPPAGFRRAVRSERRLGVRQRAGHAFDPDRWPGSCRSGTAVAGFERQPRARHLRRAQAPGRRRAAARAEPVGRPMACRGRCCAPWRSRSFLQF